MSFTVTKVIDGDTVEVDPEWNWESKKATGSRVRLANVDAPELKERGGLAAKQKLEKLLLNKEVDLKNPVNISYSRLVCDVYLGNKNIANSL